MNKVRLFDSRLLKNFWNVFSGVGGAVGASINYGQLLVEYLYQDWRYPIWPLNMILILRR